MAMHTLEEHSQFEPLPGLHVTADRDDLEWLMANHHGPMKCFVGYAGWGPGQLEAEIETSSWLLARAEVDAVLEAGDDEGPERSAARWASLLRLVDPVQAALALNPRIVPSDPSHN